MDATQRAARAYVRGVIESSGWSASELARRCAVAPSTFNRFLHSERATHTLSARTLAKVAQASGVPLPAALGGAGAPAAGARALPAGARPAALAGGRDLPGRGRAEGGSDGAVTLDSEPIDWTWRPAELQGARDAFAMFVTGASMGEVLPEGTTVFVHPNLPPRPGDFVVVEKNSHEALVKRLVRRSQTGITLRQYDPARDFDIPRRDIRAIYRVIGAAFP
jgi:phage repressor protein C with HTH and peptisase S24 domain